MDAAILQLWCDQNQFSWSWGRVWSQPPCMCCPQVMHCLLWILVIKGHFGGGRLTFGDMCSPAIRLAENSLYIGDAWVLLYKTSTSGNQKKEGYSRWYSLPWCDPWWEGNKGRDFNDTEYQWRLHVRGESRIKWHDKVKQRRFNMLH